MAFSCLADFDRDVYSRGGKYEERFDFFMVVFVIGWVVVLFVFFVFLLSFEGKITTEKNWNIIVSILLYQCTLTYRRGGEGRGEENCYSSCGASIYLW